MITFMLTSLLGVKFRTKRLKTCQEPTATMPANIAATNSSMERSIAAKSAFMCVPMQTTGRVFGGEPSLSLFG